MTPRQFDSYSNGLLVGRKTRAKVAGIAMFFKELSVATYVPNTIGPDPFVRYRTCRVRQRTAKTGIPNDFIDENAA